MKFTILNYFSVLNKLFSEHTIIILSVFIFLVFPVGDRHDSLVGRFQVSGSNMPCLFVTASDVQSEFHAALWTEIYASALLQLHKLLITRFNHVSSRNFTLVYCILSTTSSEVNGTSPIL